MTWSEVNFDGLVGLTHHYGGLGAGNLASLLNRHAVSRPRAAALEGLTKMKLLADLGIRQAILPPHPRPHWGALQAAGFRGTPAEMIEQAAGQRPELLSIVYSSAFMWTANAATVSPSPDTADKRLHLTTANLLTTPHRRLEAGFTSRLLRAIFSDPRHFAVHDPLPADSRFADEGAANHTRWRTDPANSRPGIELFVYGNDKDAPADSVPQRFVPRQTRQASEQVARQHQLDPDHCLFVRQTPQAIDAGVFHNDVIAVGHENVLLCHEQAFVGQPRVLEELSRRVPDLQICQVSALEMTLEDAVRTYLFNSQLLSLPEGGMLLLCPAACESDPAARPVIDRLLSGPNPIHECRYVSLEQSLRNGGGPACLRLRVLMNEEQQAAIPSGLWLTPPLYAQLCRWVEQYYRETLSLADLADPSLAEEAAAALEALAILLGLDVRLYQSALTTV